MTLAHIDEYRPAAPAVTTTNPWIELMGPAAQLANDIANTGFVPAEFRNKPAEIAACILYGAEIGVGPMQSLAKIDIVKGRPAPRAELGRALALAAGHDVWVVESTNTKVTVAGRRRGSQNVQQVTWTMDDARKAGIASNPNYAKYPRQMLLARASAELVRAMCPDVLGGITSFAEEAQDIEDGPLAVTAAVEPEPKAKATRKRRDPAPPAEPAIEDAEVVEDDRPSEAQTKMAMASFAEQGITDRSDRLSATSALLGRQVETWNELSRAEASTVIDGLERLKAGAVTFRVDDDGTWHAEAVGDDLLDAEPVGE